MMKIPVNLFFLLFITFSFAQINQVDNESGTFQTGNIDSPFLRASEKSGNKIVGSIYLNEEWTQATIVDGVSINKNVMARFNAYHSEIEIIKNNNISAILPSKGLKLVLNDKSFVPIKLPTKSKNVFAESLVEGNFSLFKVYDIKINKAPSDAKLLNLESVDKVNIVDHLYFKKDDKVSKFPTGKKDIQRSLPKDFLALAKKEQISLRKEKEIIKLINLYNAK